MLHHNLSINCSSREKVKKNKKNDELYLCTDMLQTAIVLVNTYIQTDMMMQLSATPNMSHVEIKENNRISPYSLTAWNVPVSKAV